MRNKIYASILAGLLVGCQQGEESSDSSGGDSGSGDEGGSAPSGDTGALAISDNGLAIAYPEGLTVTAFPQSVDSNPGAAAPGSLQTGLRLNGPSADSTELKHPREALTESQDRLNGDAQSCFDNGLVQAFGSSPNITEYCFGFDYGIVSGEAIGTGDGGQVNNIVQSNNSSVSALKSALEGASGLQADSSGEACMVKVGRHMVSAVASKLNGSLGFLGGLLCEAKKAGSDTFSSATVDLAETASGKLPDGLTLSKAEITSLDGGVYKTEIDYSTASQSSSKIIFYHKPGESGNDTYSGVLNFYEGEDQNGNNAFRSMSYAKSGSDTSSQRLKIEVRDVRYTNAAGVSDPFLGDGTLDPNTGVTVNDGNDKLSGVKYFAFDVNPSSFAGSLSFWVNPGGNYEEPPRGFVYETAQDSAGRTSGCAWSGAFRDTSIRKAIADGSILKPTGCYTPQISNGVCGTSSDKQGNDVWKQCFTQNSSGIYEIDNSKVTDTSAGYDVLPSAPSDTPEIPIRSSSGVGSVK